MSTKSKELSTVLASSVESDVDFKLSKQDIIDLVVEEKRTEYERLIAAKEAEILHLNELFKALRKEFSEKLLIQAKADTKALAAFLKKNFKKELEYNFYNQVDSLRGLIEHTREYDEDSRGRGSYRHTPKKTDFLAKNSAECYLVSVSFETARRGHCSDEQKLNFEIVSSGRVFPASALHKETMKQLQTLADAYVAAHNEASQAREEMASLTSMGRKAKAALIKRILESSGSGKAILSSLSAVRTSLVDAIAIDVAPKSND